MKWNQNTYPIETVKYNEMKSKRREIKTRAYIKKLFGSFDKEYDILDSFDLLITFQELYLK